MLSYSTKMLCNSTKLLSYSIKMSLIYKKCF